MRSSAISSIPILVVLLAPTGASANDPMAGWLHQQQMAYQRNRTVKGGVPRSTGSLLSPGKVLSTKKQPATSTTRKAPAKDEAATVESTPPSTAASVKETKEPKDATAETSTKEASVQPKTSPGAAYALGRMVRRLIQAFDSGSAKPAKAVSKQTTTPRIEEPKAPAETPKSFTPPPRQLKVASPASLFLLRQARLISVADYQAASLRFLGAR